jgi:hypothetical protein
MTLPWLGISTGYRPWLHAVVLSLLLNVGFIALSFSSNLVPREAVAEGVRQAFATGELIERDYLPYDTRRGWHQYNDCIILQMIVNPDSSLAGRALGPWLHVADSSHTEVCRTLRELVVDGRDPATLVSSRYTRYWHGYIPVISPLLTVLDISTVRGVLRAAVYAAVVILLLAGVRERGFLPLAGAVAIAGALFWGLPYFGQGLSHPLGDSAVMLGIACLILWHRKFAGPGTLLPFCASFGAVVVFFEMLTGPLPTAGGLLFPTVYLLSRFTHPFDAKVGHHFWLATAAVTAFALGAAITVAARIAIAATLVQPHGLDVFLGNLELYTRPLSTELPVPGFVPRLLQPLGRLIWKGEAFTYGSNFGLIGLYMSAALAWLVAAWLALKQRSRLGWADVAAFAFGALSIPAWSVILPTHTFIHAAFMARILIVPISLGWAALLWQLWLRRAWNKSDSKPNAGRPLRNESVRTGIFCPRH